MLYYTPWYCAHENGWLELEYYSFLFGSRPIFLGRARFFAVLHVGREFFGGSTCLKGCLLPSGTDQIYGSNLMYWYQFQGLLLESHMWLGIHDIPWCSGIFPVFVSGVSFVGANRRCQAFSKGLTF